MKKIHIQDINPSLDKGENNIKLVSKPSIFKVENKDEKDNLANNLMQNIFTNLNIIIEQNNKLGKEFLNCKDSKDLNLFQYKLFSLNLASVFKCYFDAFMIFEKFTLNNIEKILKKNGNEK